MSAPLHDRHAPTILVVDDSPDMRSLLADVLEHSGYRVLTAASGMRALGLMADERPDLVITDLLMPGMSGFSFRSAMLRRPDLADIPVIVLSAYWRRPGETLEAVEVLTKPLNIDRLVAAVSRLLGRDDDRRPAGPTPPGAYERRAIGDAPPEAPADAAGASRVGGSRATGSPGSAMRRPANRPGGSRRQRA